MPTHVPSIQHPNLRVAITPARFISNRQEQTAWNRVTALHRLHRDNLNGPESRALVRKQVQSKPVVVILCAEPRTAAADLGALR